MPFLTQAPVKVGWKRLIDAAMASDAAYAVKPAIKDTEWHAVDMRNFGAGAIPRKNIGADPLTFVTDDGRGAAVLLHTGSGLNKKYMLAFRGTDQSDLHYPTKTDIIGWIDAFSGEYVQEFRSLLMSVDAHLRKNPGELTVSGHSLGGWITNKLKSDYSKFGGEPDIWGKALYAAFESPLIRQGVFNFGFQNDLVYKLVSPLQTYIGPERIWVDNGFAPLTAHDRQAYIYALHLLQNGTFSNRIDFSDNIFIRTAYAAKVTRDFAIVGKEGFYSSSVESFYLGSNKDDVFNLTLKNTVTSYIDLAGGNDTLKSARNAKEVIIGKQGADEIFAGDGNDTVSGDGHYQNHSSAPLEVSLLYSASGHFHHWFGPAKSLVSGGGAFALAQRHAGPILPGRTEGRGFDDKLSGENGHDVLFAGGGNDHLHGGQGSDLLVGGSGADKLYGGAHNDVLFGGPGEDVLSGGPGNDLYIVDRLDFVIEAAGGGIDTAVIAQNGSYNINNVEYFALADGVSNVSLNVMELDYPAKGANTFMVSSTAANAKILINNTSKSATQYTFYLGVDNDDDTFVFTRPFIEGSSIYTSKSDADVIFDVTRLGFKGVIGQTLDISKTGTIADGLYVMERTWFIKFKDNNSNVDITDIRHYDKANNILDSSFDDGHPNFVHGIVSAKNGVFHKIADLSYADWDWLI